MTWYIAGSIQFSVNSIRIFFTYVNSGLYMWYWSLFSPFTFIHSVHSQCFYELLQNQTVFIHIKQVKDLISFCFFHFSGVHIKISKWQIPFEMWCVKFPNNQIWFLVFSLRDIFQILHSIKKRDDTIWYKTIWKEIKLTRFCKIPYMYCM